MAKISELTFTAPALASSVTLDEKFQKPLNRMRWMWLVGNYSPLCSVHPWTAVARRLKIALPRFTQLKLQMQMMFNQFDAPVEI